MPRRLASAGRIALSGATKGIRDMLMWKSGAERSPLIALAKCWSDSVESEHKLERSASKSTMQIRSG